MEDHWSDEDGHPGSGGRRTLLLRLSLGRIKGGMEPTVEEDWTGGTVLSWSLMARDENRKRKDPISSPLSPHLARVLCECGMI